VHNDGAAAGFAMEMVPFGNSMRFLRLSRLAGFYGHR
jgi:hypothetical protein